jgi:hypothetical protein
MTKHGSGQRLTINLLEMRIGASPTCNPANLARSSAVAGQTSHLSSQAVAYDMEILQLCASLCHEKLHQLRCQFSCQNGVPTSGDVVGGWAQDSPVHTDNVVISLGQVGCNK